MTFFPKGRAVFTGLDCYYLQVDRLLERLRGERFSGYLSVSAGGRQAVVPIHAGAPLPGTWTEGETTHSGVDALARLKEMAARDGAVAELHAQDAEIVSLLAGYEPKNRLYGELEGLLVDPDRLFEMLRKKRLTGLLRVYRVRSRRRLGMQLLQMGKITEAQLARAVREQLTRTSGKTLLGGILLELGIITQEDLNRCLAEQVESGAATSADEELGVAVLIQGELKTPASETRTLLAQPGAIVDIYSLAPIRKAAA